MRRLLFLSLLVLPAFASAQAIDAGFPSQTIWVSNTTPVEGETLVVSAVVYNGDTEDLRGTLVFMADGARIGAREFELPPGESQVHSVEWKPKAGEYRLAAAIEGTSAELSQSTTPAITLIVAKPPPPSAIQQTVSSAVNVASTIASSSIPVITTAAKSVFDAIEPVRQAGVARLEAYLEESGGAGIVAGTSTSNTAGFGTSTAAGTNPLSKFTQMAAAAALFTMKSMALFYPLLALFFLGTLYALGKRVRRRPND